MVHLPRIIRHFPPIGLIMLALGAFLIASIACRRNPAQPADTAFIALVGQSELHPQWTGVAGGMRRIRNELPELRCESLATPVETDVALVALVQGLLARKPAAVCLFVTNPALARRAAQRITDSGPLLITIGQEIPDSAAFGHVDVNWTQGAELLADALPNLAGQRRTYVLLHGARANTADRESYLRFRTTADDRAEPFRLESLDCTGSSLPDAVRSLLRKFPSSGLVAVVSLDQFAFRRATSADIASWLAPERPVIALGATPDRWDWLNDGRAAALAGPLDADLGYAAIKMAQAALRADSGVRKRVSIDCQLVTRDSLAKFQTDYETAAGFTADHDR